MEFVQTRLVAYRSMPGTTIMLSVTMLQVSLSGTNHSVDMPQSSSR